MSELPLSLTKDFEGGMGEKRKKKRVPSGESVMLRPAHFNEQAQAEQIKLYKKKILHHERERYGEMVPNDRRARLLKRIHERVYKVLPDLPKGEPHLLSSPDINAFAIRGEPDVFFHDGLLRQYVHWCKANGEEPSEDANAFVVIHELGHVQQGTQEMDPLDEEGGATKEPTEEESKRTKQQHLNDEYDADRFAIQMMARAGYNPREGLKMLKFLQSLNDGLALPMTHPRSEDRLRELIALVESPDTIIQNTDKPPTKLSNELIKELSQEDPHRPGTALYRKAGMEHLEDFLSAAETLPDALEVVQVAQMHRHLQAMNRLRQAEAVRSVYAKYVVVENIRGVVDLLRRTYTDSRSPYSNKIAFPLNLPTNTTRYVMREYGYAEAQVEPHPRGDEFEKGLATDLKVSVDGSFGSVLQSITGQLKEVSQQLGKRVPGSPEYVRWMEYQGKLEGLRDQVAATLEGVDASVLGHMAANVELDPDQDWFGRPESRTWVKTASPEEMLIWCSHNGTVLFSPLLHPIDEEVRRAIGDIAKVDSRYQAYLPPELVAPENLLTPAGRAAFIEQSILVHVEDRFRSATGHGYGYKDFSAATIEVTERLQAPLSAKLQARYAGLRASQALSQAMAAALLSDEYEVERALMNLTNDLSPTDAQVWLMTMKPLAVGYASSANALFAGETGLNPLGQLIPNVSEKFYRLEQRCTQMVHQVLEDWGETAVVPEMTHDRLVEAISLGDGHVRADALKQMVTELKKQSWTTAGVAEFEARLTPILQLLKPKERLWVLEDVLGGGHREFANISAVIEYATEACGEYAQRLLNWKWDAFVAATTQEKRRVLLRSVYAHHEEFSGLSEYTYDKTFKNKLGIEYITLSNDLEGEPGFITALINLAKGGFAYSKLNQPLFADEAVQQRLEALPDEVMLRIALAFKEGDAAGQVRDASNNGFAFYVTQRVLAMYGVQGFHSMGVAQCTFDTARPFQEVVHGIGGSLLPYFLEDVLNACVKAYKKTPADLVREGLAHYYPPIPTSVLQVGQSFKGAQLDQRRLDYYADLYDSSAKPFYEQHTYESSPKREAIEAYIVESGLLRDRMIPAGLRLEKIVALIPEKTNYRDQLFAEVEADWLKEWGIKTEGHRLVMEAADSNPRAVAEFFYGFYVTALPFMVDQARMQLWGRRAEALHQEYLVVHPPVLAAELVRLQQLFPMASFARDEALYTLGNSSLVRTPEQARQVQNLLSEMQRQTHDKEDLAAQSQLERMNLFMGHLSRTEKKDFILWTIGADDEPPKSLRAYGALNRVSVEAVPGLVFAATPQEREQFLLRMFVGSNGLFESNQPEDRAVVAEFIDRSFGQIFPDDPTTGVVGQPREMLRTVFATVLTEYEPYRRGKIFIGILESLRHHKNGGRGEKIAALMAELGPVFVKVGQVLSETEASPGEYLLPEDVRTAMKRLKQSAKRFHRLAAVFSLEAANEFKADNPNRIVEVGETLAAASIKQVNAVVRADGKEAVEKVLRPSIEKHLEEDVRVLAVIVERLRPMATIPRGVEEAGATYVQEEADFAREVANTQKIRTALEAYKESGVVRQMPVRTTEVYSSSKTHIQEERVKGIALEELTQLAETPESMHALAEKYGLDQEQQQFYQALAADTARVRLQAFDAFVFQYFQADAFHSDPHAGNIFVAPDGALVLIDNGSIGETNKADREHLKTFFLGFAQQQPEKIQAAVSALAQGLKKKDLDAVATIARGPLNDADKMNQILAVVTGSATQLNPAFDKFLKSFATGAYLMSGLKKEDVRTILAAYTQGERGSLRSRMATAAARAAHENPNSLIGTIIRRFIR